MATGGANRRPIETGSIRNAADQQKTKPESKPGGSELQGVTIVPTAASRQQSVNRPLPIPPSWDVSRQRNVNRAPSIDRTIPEDDRSGGSFIQPSSSTSLQQSVNQIPEKRPTLRHPATQGQERLISQSRKQSTVSFATTVVSTKKKSVDQPQPEASAPRTSTTGSRKRGTVSAKRASLKDEQKEQFQEKDLLEKKFTPDIKTQEWNQCLFMKEGVITPEEVLIMPDMTPIPRMNMTLTLDFFSLVFFFLPLSIIAVFLHMKSLTDFYFSLEKGDVIGILASQRLRRASIIIHITSGIVTLTIFVFAIVESVLQMFPIEDEQYYDNHVVLYQLPAKDNT